MNTDEIIVEIEDTCLKTMTREELFHDLLRQIKEHVEKVTKLKEIEDWPGHMKEEIVDIMLLTKGLFYLENIDDAQVFKGAEYTLSKIREVKK